MITHKITTLVKSKGYSYLALFSLYSYTLTVIPFESLSKIFHIFLVLISLPILISERKSIFKDPMVILLGAALIVQVLSWVNSALYYPEFSNEIPKLDRLGRLFLFIFIAYWLKGSIKYTYITLSCFIISIVFGFIFHSDSFINELLMSFQGVRVDFSIKNAQFTSMFSGVGLIVSVFLVHHSIKSNLKKELKTLSIILFSCFCLFFLTTTLITQSRQVWLALAILIFLAPVLIKKITHGLQTKNITVFYILVAILSAAIINIDLVRNRIVSESETVNTIVQNGLDDIPMTSIGIRINSWIEASKWVAYNPIVGAGSEAIPQVMIRSEKFQTETLPIPLPHHLHNYHIETLVAYGLLGVLTLYAIYGWLIMSLLRIKNDVPEALQFILLAASFCCFWLIINLFESFNSRTYGVFTHNIILGCCYTFYLTHALQSKIKE